MNFGEICDMLPCMSIKSAIEVQLPTFHVLFGVIRK